MNKAIILCLGVVFLFLLYFLPVETEDVWWHLSVGRWIFEHGQVPHFDPFPYATEHLAWSGHNEWLGSGLLYLVFKLGGLLGLKIFRCLILILICGIFFFYGRRSVPFSILFAVTVLVGQCFIERLFLRPELFNLLFIQIFLVMLFEYERTSKIKYLCVLPLLGVIWFNLHMGAVIYGGVLISIFLFSAVIRKSYISAKHLFLIILAYFASFLFTPYGFDGFLYPFKVFLFPDFISFYKLKGFIGENLPPGYIFASLNHSYIIALILLGAIALYLNRRDKFSSIIVFSVSLFVFLTSIRNIGFFTIVAGCVIVNTLRSLDMLQVWKTWRWSKIADLVLITALGVFLVFRVHALVTTTVHYNGVNENFLSVESNRFSREAIDFLLENKINGGVFNVDVLGNEIIFKGYPSLRPLLDGRFVDRERFNNYHAVLENPKECWSRAVVDYDLRVAVLNAGDQSYEKLIDHLSIDTNWQLVSIKGPLVIYVKRDTFDLPQALNTFQNDLASVPVLASDVQKLRDLIADASTFIGKSIVRVDLLTEAKALMVLRYNGAAAQYLIKAFEVSNQAYVKRIAKNFLRVLEEEVK